MVKVASPESHSATQRAPTTPIELVCGRGLAYLAKGEGVEPFSKRGRALTGRQPYRWFHGSGRSRQRDEALFRLRVTFV